MLESECKAATKENFLFACVLKRVEPVQNFYKITLQPKTKVTLKEEDKLEMDNNIVTILEVLYDCIICKSNKIMSKSECVAKKCNDNIKKVQKRFTKYIESRKENPTWIDNICELDDDKNDTHTTKTESESTDDTNMYMCIQNLNLDTTAKNSNNTEFKNVVTNNDNNEINCSAINENAKDSQNGKKIENNISITNNDSNEINCSAINENSIDLQNSNNIETNILNKYNDINCSADIKNNDKAHITDKANDHFYFTDQNLNQSQKNAVLAALEGINYKILGPPGTGKTKTIVEIILQLSKHKKKVLVCGPSNASIDNILKQYIDSQKINKQNNVFFRLGSSYKCFDGFERYNLNYMAEQHVDYLGKDLNMYKTKKDKEGAHVFDKINNKLQGNNKKANKYKRVDKSAYKNANANHNDILKDKKERIKRFCNDKIKEANVVFSTLFSTIKIDNTVFDYVIIDECCQGTEIEVFLNMLMAKNFLLAGDPYQLGPVNAFNKGLYEKLNVKTFFLDQQYRMPDKLIKFSNEYFYKSKIKSIKRGDEICFFGESSIIFVDTYDSYFTESDNNKSKYNKEEANIIVTFVKYLQNNHQNISIGIITPYSAQVEMLTEMIDDKNIKINTVDSFQGQEKDVIIFSMVRSNEDKDIGFLEEIRRTNVAITRCKKGLFVVGNSYNFQKNVFYDKFVQFLYENGFCIDPVNFDKIANI
ncbi:hypothetical protein BDAP_001517 [Binucleata daphniae]